MRKPGRIIVAQGTDPRGIGGAGSRQAQDAEGRHARAGNGSWRTILGREIAARGDRDVAKQCGFVPKSGCQRSLDVL
jgi:hypothetical protein